MGNPVGSRTRNRLEKQLLSVGSVCEIDEGLRFLPGSRKRAAYPCPINALDDHGRPLTGARIETLPAEAQEAGQPVAPSRGRGSKRIHDRGAGVSLGRPLTGARIETPRLDRLAKGPAVAPSRGRGSKPSSPPGEAKEGCRPLTGARIETDQSTVGQCQAQGRPLTGARIETLHASPAG